MSTSSTTTLPNRLHSLDALRGFDMFWIIGGEFIFHELATATGTAPFTWIAHQLHHVAWNGFVFYDLIFPLFLFIAGVAMPYSITRRVQKGENKSAIARHIIQRGLILVFLGMVYNGFFQFDWENTRYPSVLGRIGLGYLFAGIIFLYTDIRQQVIWFAALLLGYWASMMLIPVPGFGAGNLTVEGSLAGYIDRLLIPGKLYLEVHDPEGLFSTIPAISTALLGALAGHFLADSSRGFSPSRKALVLAGAGLAAILLGYLWGIFFPINKNLWTSSFVLVAGGWSLLLLSLFYYLIDVRGWQKWAFFFVVIGLNPITIYMAQTVLDIGFTTHFLFDGMLGYVSESYREVFYYLGYTLLGWLLVYGMYKFRIFLKV